MAINGLCNPIIDSVLKRISQTVLVEQNHSMRATEICNVMIYPRYSDTLPNSYVIV